MLRIYQDIRQFNRDIRSIVESLPERDDWLRDQLRRSARSLMLNVAEGMAAMDGNRRKAYRVALREARECLAALEAAEDWSQIDALPAGVMDRGDKIVATLFKLVRA